MGSDINCNTLFLEFYGLPGCGKSTISHLVAEELRKKGKQVKEPTYDSDHKLSENKRKCIKLLKLIRYTLLHPQKYKRLIKLVKSNGYTGLMALSQAVNIVPKLWEYDHAMDDYVVFDEGLVQSSISLVKDGDNSKYNEEMLFSLCAKRFFKKIYIKVSVDTALERMQERDKHDSRIEKITEEETKQRAIRIVEMLCESISPNLVIDDSPIRDSIEMILNQI